MKIILGAGATNYSGWVSTQENELNLLNRNDFEKNFEENTIDAMLAEHVWEHMTKEEGVIAAKNCYDFLKEGGYIRAAVPDVNFKNQWYQNMVKAGGPGSKDHPAYTHKIVYDYLTFAEVFRAAGFEVELLEYCDEDGIFNYKYWNEADGKIGRSFRFDTRNSKDMLGMVSIIIDAKKPRKINSSIYNWEEI
ncbi:MAG: class I SAM-dependent methyltransferase [Paraclostridium sp.]|uniref:class I SAM-dependent methyltransferase n=1 Tax=Paraclostridium sp. TaxID=2023273 RepID=UPI003F33A745